MPEAWWTAPRLAAPREAAPRNQVRLRLPKQSYRFAIRQHNMNKLSNYTTVGQKALSLKSALLVLLIAIAGPVLAEGETKPIVALGESEELSNRLIQALDAKGDDYVPRTEHFLPDGEPVYTNRLILEASPYLIQHAHNPVNWYPWGDEAFAKARKENKPVFLSIGYATCHWCHVMERESFENEDIAEIMNEHFISVKVDREQLPDVDAMYMTAVMMIAGNGGWPMSSWLDDQGRPFYGGTYFPPEHFSQLLNRINDLWHTDNGALMQQADQVSAAMNKVNANAKAAEAFGSAEIDAALSQVINGFDSVNGGFGDAPKFPREPTLYYLLYRAQQFGDEDAKEVALGSLAGMAKGGIHDHVAGGFHRYTVDSTWLTPHFEKMLYNQAALSRNYTQAWQLTGDTLHKRTASRVLDYVLREMRSADGLFYSATDADSEGAEGRFFIWTPEELDELLGDDAELAKKIWNVTGEGSFEGESILHMTQPIDQLAELNQISTDALLAKVDSWSEILLEARQSREKPLLDNKVITAWNGMMITAFAEGSSQLNNNEYLTAATTAADALWKTMRKPDNSLFRSYFEGAASIEGTQPDYAYFAEALIAIYDVTGEKHWLDKAIALTDEMHNRFWDAKDGGYFMGADTVAGTKLAIRPKDIYDNSMPTGNSVAMRVLAKLFKRSGEPRFESRADELIVSMSGSISTAPAGFFYFLLGANEHQFGESGPKQYAARGRVTALAKREGDQLKVSLNIAPGWHVNSNQPNQEYLIPTRLHNANAEELPGVSYPEAINQSLSFEKTELSLFEGELTITAPWPKSAAADFQLQLQACDDKRCLPPETLSLSMTEVAARGN